MKWFVYALYLRLTCLPLRVGQLCMLTPGITTNFILQSFTKPPTTYSLISPASLDVPSSDHPNHNHTLPSANNWVSQLQTCVDVDDTVLTLKAVRGGDRRGLRSLSGQEVRPAARQQFAKKTQETKATVVIIITLMYFDAVPCKCPKNQGLTTLLHIRYMCNVGPTGP